MSSSVRSLIYFSYTKHQIGNGLRGNGSGDYTYLGPVGNSATGPFGDNRGNVNGFGIILEDGTDYQKNYQDTNTDGKGNTGGNAWLAWANPYWWDEENNRGYAWIVNFSTKNIATNHLSMQLSVSNNAGNQVSKPRFWKAEWSLTGDMDNEADWNYITSYTEIVAPLSTQEAPLLALLFSGIKRIYTFSLPSKVNGSSTSMAL